MWSGSDVVVELRPWCPLVTGCVPCVAGSEKDGLTVAGAVAMLWYPMDLNSSPLKGNKVMNLYLSITWNRFELITQDWHKKLKLYLLSKWIELTWTVGLPTLRPHSSSTAALRLSTLTTLARSPMFDSNSRNLFQISRLSFGSMFP